MRVALALVLALLAAGCKPERVRVEYICVKLYAYSRGEIDTLAKEVEAIEAAAPTVISWIEDYVVLRDAIKKCMAKKAEAQKSRR